MCDEGYFGSWVGNGLEERKTRRPMETTIMVQGRSGTETERWRHVRDKHLELSSVGRDDGLDLAG